MKARALFAEGLGTALLVFFGAGTATLTFGFKVAGTSPSAGVVARSRQRVAIGDQITSAPDEHLPLRAAVGVAMIRLASPSGSEERAPG